MMASEPAPTTMYEDDRYLIRPASSTNEFRDVWWNFMQDLGWNRGYYDLDTYMNPSLGCGMILLIDKLSGLPVGHVAGVVNENSTGWVSLFVVDEGHRGKGLGRLLFKAAENDLVRRGMKYIGLDGVVEQRGTYERRGFVASPLGKITIMVRSLLAKEPMAHVEPLSGSQLMDIRDVPPDLLAEHEASVTGFERPALWSQNHMFHRQDVQGVALVLRRPPMSRDDISGWAIVRRCSGGFRVGPVYAENLAYAKAVLAAAMRLATVEAIQRVPLPNGAMNDFASERVVEDATLVAEVWGGNSNAYQLFTECGWTPANVEYDRMWVDGKATAEQEAGGAAQRGVYAIFDAAVG